MIVFVGLNLCFDIVTVYTVNGIVEVTPSMNRFFHQIFIGTLEIIIVLLYLYVEILGHNQKRMNIGKLLISMIPFAGSLIMVAYGKLYYHTGVHTSYSYGTMAISLFFVIAFYMILIILNTYLYKDVLRKEKRTGIRRGVMIWMMAAVIQYFNPELLISGVAEVMMLLFVYMSFENPMEHIDESTDTFNKRAFHLMLSEKTSAKKRLYIVSIVVDNYDRIQIITGHDNANKLFEELGNGIKDICKKRVYHSRSNVLSFFIEGDGQEIPRLVERICMLTQEPFRIEDYSISIQAHADVIDSSLYTGSCDEIYDMMNYMAEKNFKNSDRFLYVVDEELVNEKSRQMIIENMLHKAVDTDGFDVVYQPIFNVKEDRFSSAEALVRLKDTDTLGFVSPEEFIRIAEKKGMIMDLGRIVFEKVCSFAKSREAGTLGVEYIEVNLSGIQCINPELPRQLSDIMEVYGVSPEFINLEITETATVESGEMLQRNMKQLRKMGCSFSMDDFGTGYSNLSQMSEVVYDLVKLDKSLIWPCFGDINHKSKAILGNVVNMLLELNVNIVAEGVETHEMAVYLKEIGVKYLQGYYYSRPLVEEDYIKFLYNKNK